MMDTDINRYPFIWRVLHWLSALVILWAIGSGFYILIAKPNEYIVHQIADFNVAITLLFVPVFMGRLVMIYFLKKPETPQLPSQQQKMASRAHACIYVVVSTVLVSGVLMMDRNMSIFNWLELNSVFEKGAVTEFFFILHRSANVLLTLLLTVHILAVIKHQINGIPIIKKMI